MVAGPFVYMFHDNVHIRDWIMTPNTVDRHFEIADRSKALTRVPRSIEEFPTRRPSCDSAYDLSITFLHSAV